RGRIGPGCEVNELTAAAQPHRTLRLGRFTELTYYPGGPPGDRGLPMESLVLVAKDGRLVGAAAGGWFGNRELREMGGENQAAYQEELVRYLDERRKEEH